ncbi:MAG: lysophospholipid acyltransferase family protein [bacterium]|nr:MAG: lysophospholipid acyltransferase family protein [bacterium]
MAGIGKLIFTLAALFLNAVPGALRDCIAGTGATIYFLVSPTSRKNVRKNLVGIGARVSNGAVLGILHNHVRNILEIFASSRWHPKRIEQCVTCEGREALESAIRTGKGAILVTAHVGNWELAALYLRTLGYGIHVVAGIQMNRLLTRAVKEAKEAKGITVVGPDRSYRNLIEALNSNNLVALLLDGDIYTGGEVVPFFGKEVPLPRGPIQLGRRTGSPIVGGYCRRINGGAYHLHLETIFEAGELEHMPEPHALRRLYARVEGYIRANNDQWCMLRDFWRPV